MNIIHHIKQYTEDVVHLFYPHVCIGCGTDVIERSATLCAYCFSELPVTDYFMYANNPVERLFAGRILIQKAGSAFYFTKKSVLQNIMHELKYKGNREAGLFMGKQTALAMQQSKRFEEVDVIIPMPLSSRRLQQRGYNQATIIAQGMASVLRKPVHNEAVVRNKNTTTQTGKDRTSRWQTMQYAFAINNAGLLQGRHVLLVDDIVTTGATLEACGDAILAVPDVTLSIATVAYTNL